MYDFYVFAAAPRVTSISDEGCTVDWSPIKPLSRDQANQSSNSELQYQVQLTKVRDNDAKIVSHHTIFVHNSDIPFMFQQMPHDITNIH